MTLLPSDVAAEFYRTERWREFNSANDLLGEIDTYLARRGLARSTISRLDIASAFLRLQIEASEAESVQIPTPEEFAAQENITSGWGDNPPYPGSAELPPGDQRAALANFLMGN